MSCVTWGMLLISLCLTFSRSGIDMIKDSNNPVGGDEDEIKMLSKVPGLQLALSELNVLV